MLTIPDFVRAFRPVISCQHYGVAARPQIATCALLRHSRESDAKGANQENLRWRGVPGLLQGRRRAGGRGRGASARPRPPDRSRPVKGGGAVKWLRHNLGYAENAHCT